MKTRLTMLAVLCATTGFASGDAVEAKLKAAEQDARLAKLEALVLREQIATQQVEKIRADQQAMYGEACKAAGLPADPAVCAIDLNAKTVSRKAVPESRSVPAETAKK
jgi:hypothetical protein